MCVVQKSNRDFLNAVLISLTYDLKDVGRPSLTGGSAHELLDINRFPVIDPDHSATNISVCTCSDLVVALLYITLELLQVTRLIGATTVGTGADWSPTFRLYVLVCMYVRQCIGPPTSWL